MRKRKRAGKLVDVFCVTLGLGVSPEAAACGSLHKDSSTKWYICDRGQPETDREHYFHHKSTGIRALILGSCLKYT